MRTLLTVSQDLNRAQQRHELVKTASLTLVGELRVSSVAIFGVTRENQPRFDLLGVRGFAAERFNGLTIDRSSAFVKTFEKEAHPAQISRSDTGFRMYWSAPPSSAATRESTSSCAESTRTGRVS